MEFFLFLGEAKVHEVVLVPGDHGNFGEAWSQHHTAQSSRPADRTENGLFAIFGLLTDYPMAESAPFGTPKRRRGQLFS